MLEQFSRLTAITGQNWRERAQQQAQAEAKPKGPDRNL